MFSKGSASLNWHKSYNRIATGSMTRNMAKDTKIYRKSGTWKNFHADGGVVVHRNNEYIIVGIVEHPEGGEGLSELVVLVDDLMEKMK